MSFFPVIELFDRLAIAEVKWARTRSNQEELEWYQQQITEKDMNAVWSDFQELKKIHDTIWGLEGQLKTGREAELPLEELGRRAILIRDWNNKRVAVKNHIADQLKTDQVREIKTDHLSE